MLEMVATAVPELEISMGCVALLPTFTLPKLKLAGLTDKVADPLCVWF